MEAPTYDENSTPSVIPDEPPDPSTPWTIGLLNVIFGALLIIGGICSGLNFGLQWAMGPIIAKQQQQIQQAVEAQRQADLRKLEDIEKAAVDENEKAELRSRRQALQNQPVPKIPDVSKFMRDSRFMSYLVGDVVSGLVLNVLMVTAGVGLLGLRKWGRDTALWVAGLKILRLVIMYSYFAVMVVPGVVRQFAAMFEEMMKSMPAGGGAPVPGQIDAMATAMGVMMVFSAIGMILLGAIYPVIVLILLNRRAVKLAFTPAQ